MKSPRINLYWVLKLLFPTVRIQRLLWQEGEAAVLLSHPLPQGGEVAGWLRHVVLRAEEGRQVRPHPLPPGGQGRGQHLAPSWRGSRQRFVSTVLQTFLTLDLTNKIITELFVVCWHNFHLIFSELHQLFMIYARCWHWFCSHQKAVIDSIPQSRQERLHLQ